MHQTCLHVFDSWTPEKFLKFPENSFIVSFGNTALDMFACMSAVKKRKCFIFLQVYDQVNAVDVLYVIWLLFNPKNSNGKFPTTKPPKISLIFFLLALLSQMLYWTVQVKFHAIRKCTKIEHTIICIILLTLRFNYRLPQKECCEFLVFQL